MVKAAKQRDLQRQLRNYAGKECITVVLWSECLTIFEVENQKLPFSECVSMALSKQHVKHKSRIILFLYLSLAIPYFSTLSHTRNFSEKNLTLIPLKN